MEYLNINILKTFLLIALCISLGSCNSAKTNKVESFFDEISSSEFKIEESDLDIYVPHVQILFKKNSGTMDEKLSESMRRFFIDRFDGKFRIYYSADIFYAFPEFVGDVNVGNKVMDSILDKNIKFLPNILRKHISKDKKYSLISNFNGYHLEKRVDYNLFIFNNETFEKVYYNYTVFPANFDHGKGMLEHEQDVYTRFLKQTTTQQ
ncbi:hypothetical protein [Flavobacterium sp.]|uniref:hypothetical protein n=1 Tax=Flavobacterium sp. TaxID=239 RepID=UPI003D2A0D1D